MELSREMIEDFNQRLKILKHEIKEAPQIICFPEIRLNEEELEIISDRIFGWPKEKILKYYGGKIQLEILLKTSRFTSKEDVGDFQYLISLGVKALKSGMVL